MRAHKFAFLWCCLRAVWTLPFTSAGSICLRCVVRCVAPCVDEAQAKTTPDSTGGPKSEATRSKKHFAVCLFQIGWGCWLWAFHLESLWFSEFLSSSFLCEKGMMVGDSKSLPLWGVHHTQCNTNIINQGTKALCRWFHFSGMWTGFVSQFDALSGNQIPFPRFSRATQPKDLSAVRLVLDCDCFPTAFCFLYLFAHDSASLVFSAGVWCLFPLFLSKESKKDTGTVVCCQTC